MQVFEKIIKRLEKKIQINIEAITSMKSAPKAIDVAKTYIDAYKIAIGIVKKVAEEYNNGWIPCNERLPENNKSVLVTTTYGSIYIAYRNGKTYFDDMGEDIESTIIAWQPLPEPYQQKGE